MKKANQRAANIVQLLARIVLFLAFVPTGWHHAMHMGNFAGDAGARLRELGIVGAGEHDGQYRTGLFQGASSPGVETQYGTGMQSNDYGGDFRESPEPASSLVFVRLTHQAVEPPLVAADTSNGTDLETRSLHELTLVFDQRGLPRPEIWAWTVTAFELFGGTLILLGVFTRLWAAGLTAWAIGLFVLNTASYTTAWDAIWMTTDPSLATYRMLALMHLSLIVLAASLLLTGAGAISVDGVIFGGGKPAGGGAKE